MAGVIVEIYRQQLVHGCDGATDNIVSECAALLKSVDTNSAGSFTAQVKPGSYTYDANPQVINAEPSLADNAASGSRSPKHLFYLDSTGVSRNLQPSAPPVVS